MKRLIQGRNSLSWLQVEPRSCDQSRRKSDAFPFRPRCRLVHTMCRFLRSIFGRVHSYRLCTLRLSNQTNSEHPFSILPASLCYWQSDTANKFMFQLEKSKSINIINVNRLAKQQLNILSKSERLLKDHNLNTCCNLSASTRCESESSTRTSRYKQSLWKACWQGKM